MSPPVLDESPTADDLEVGRLELERDDVGGRVDGAGGGPTPPGPPPDRRRGHRWGDRGLPRWQALALWGAITILSFLLGVALGRLGLVIERGLLEGRP
jgi:hypothetical protein